MRAIYSYNESSKHIEIANVNNISPISTQRLVSEINGHEMMLLSDGMGAPLMGKARSPDSAA